MNDCQPSLFAWGDNSIAWIEAHLRYDWLTPFMLFFSELGQVGPILFTTGLAYWLWNKRYARALCYGLFATMFLNIWLKSLVKECRPQMQYWLEDVANSYSFPSGHSQVGVYLWFGLAFYINKKWPSLLCVFIGSFIALSRPYLGVHYPQDITAGALLGILVLALTIFSEKKSLPILTSYSIWIKALILLLFFAIYQYFVTNHRGAEVATIGATFGFWLGCQLEESTLRFNPPTQARAFIAQIVIGIAGILVLWKGGDLLRHQLDESIALGVKYLQYSLLGFWIAYGAPRCLQSAKV